MSMIADREGRLSSEAQPSPPTFDPSLYPRIYPIAGRWRLFIGACCGLFILLGLACLGILLIHPPASVIAIPFLTILCLGFIGFGVFTLVDTLRSHLILFPDAIERRGLRGNRGLARADIAGTRVVSPGRGPRLLVLVPRDSRTKRLKFPMMFTIDRDFVAWFAEIPDLDRADHEASVADAIADPGLGATEAERLKRLSTGRQVARILMFGMYAVAAWGFIAPRPYLLVMAILAALPWLAIVLVAASRGLFRIEGRRHDARPNLAFVFLAPGGVLALRALFDFQLLDWQPLLAMGLLVSGVLALAGFAADRTLRQRPWAALVLLPLVGFYAYGVVVIANAAFDGSPRTVYRTAVLAKHVSSGKHTQWELTVAPWGPRPEKGDVTVPQQFYDDTRVGDLVCPVVGQGALTIRWFFVSHCRRA